MKTEKSISLNLRLPRTLYEEIENESKERDISKARVIIERLTIDKNDTAPEPEPLDTEIMERLSAAEASIDKHTELLKEYAEILEGLLKEQPRKTAEKEVTPEPKEEKVEAPLSRTSKRKPAAEKEATPSKEETEPMDAETKDLAKRVEEAYENKKAGRKYDKSLEVYLENYDKLK